MPTDSTTVELQPLEPTSPMIRTVNKGLMVDWINRNLGERAGLSVDTALVLYDKDQLFHYALPPVLGPVPSPGLSQALIKIGARYYSTGIV